ncbi:MAG TPA: hypothetical protein VJN93_16280 [Candidatus Acidoferrum sp.]|nr:hypothetical protein [Candidatus Acidoferrum sp.]
MNPFFASALLLFAAALSQSPSPPAAQDAHHQGVVQRGDHVMGFSHDKATHHFRLYSDGGSIEAESNSPSDIATRDAIRMHFGHIAKMFAAGDFSAPMLIHSQNPPGVPVMKKLRAEIQYKIEDTPKGARIRILTKNPQALAAIHKFLRFQISDHQTGDPLAISPSRAP